MCHLLCNVATNWLLCQKCTLEHTILLPSIFCLALNPHTHTQIRVLDNGNEEGRPDLYETEVPALDTLQSSPVPLEKPPWLPPRHPIVVEPPPPVQQPPQPIVSRTHTRTHAHTITTDRELNALLCVCQLTTSTTTTNCELNVCFVSVL